MLAGTGKTAMASARNRPLLGTVRFLGTFLSDPAAGMPEATVRQVARGYPKRVGDLQIDATIEPEACRFDL